MAKILISCCNVGDSLLPLSLPYLDIDTQILSWVNLEGVAPGKLDMGCTGISVSDHGDFFVAVQSLNPRVLQFNREGSVKNVIDCPGMEDLHDVKCIGEYLYVASTGNNRLFRLDLEQLDAGPTLELLADDAPTDSIHFNSFAKGKDTGFFICCHEVDPPNHIGGMKRPDGSILASGFSAPHTILLQDEKIFLCDSSSGRVIEVSNETGEIIRSVQLGGYTRGMVYVDGKLIVGRSGKRLDSRKNPTGHLQVTSAEAYRSGLYVLNADNFAVEHFIDLSSYMWEIYDLAHVEGISHTNLFLDADLYRSVKLKSRILTLEQWLYQAMQAKDESCTSSGEKNL